MGLIHLNKQQQETNRQTNYSSIKRYKTKQITTFEKPIPLLAPLRVAFYLTLNFRADLANKV